MAFVSHTQNLTNKMAVFKNKLEAYTLFEPLVDIHHNYVHFCLF